MSRKLDALVAEKVMGWSLEYIDDPNGKRDHVWYSHDKDTHLPTPHFSTDIAAAWEVVERAHRYKIEMPYGDNGIIARMDFELNGIITPGQAQAKTTSLAICLAAFKAVGVSEAEIEEAMG